MSECVNGYKVVFLYVRINETASAFLRRYEPCPPDPGPIVAAVFLTIIFVAAVLLSMMAVVTIATSYTLKKYLYCHILLNICCVVIVDCVTNMSIAIAYVLTSPWQFGYYLCYLNSFTMLTISCEMILGVLLFTFDRLFVLKKFAPYLSLSRAKLNIIIFLTWFVSLAFSIPILAGFTSMPYTTRYSCSVSDPRDDYYLAATLAALVITPSFVLMFGVIATAIIFHKEKKKQKRVKGGPTYSYLDQILMTPYYRNEFYPSLCMVILAVGCLLMWYPYATLTTLNPMVTKDWFNKTFDPDHDNQDHIFRLDNTNRSEASSGTDTMTNSNNGTLEMDYENMQENYTNHIHLIPEMMDGPAYETATVWFRFLYDLLVPIIILLTLKEIRLKCESLILCCRPSSVDVTSPKHVSPPYVSKTPKSSGFTDLKQSNKKPKNDNKVSFKTPVLFATDEGLHIRTVEDTYLDMVDPKPLLGFGKNNSRDPKFSIEVCDIVLPEEDLTDFEGQYDLDEVIPNPHHYSDMHEENQEQSFGESVLIGANAALMSRKPEFNGKSEEQMVNHREEVVPTVSRETDEVQNEENENKKIEENFDETVEIDLEKPQKPKKHVRFDTNLIQSIPIPNDEYSTDLDESFSSINSNDSGVYGDNEFPPNESDFPSQFQNKVESSPRISSDKSKTKLKRIIHNKRVPPPSTTKKNSVNSKVTKPKLCS